MTARQASALIASDLRRDAPRIEPKAPGQRLPGPAGWRFGDVSQSPGCGVTWLA